jgi:arginase family enzyme
MKKEDIIIVNFTNVYKREHFYDKFPHTWIDCRNIKGTYGYCDVQAVSQLTDRISELSPEGIHFIDSGNYHYMSKIWTDKIREPFTLVVFDHHPDMQPPLFANLLSCGCWVKAVLDTNPYLKNVILVGADEKLLTNLEDNYKNQVHIYSQKELLHEEGWRQFAKEHVNEPVYISIDKDLLNEENAVTDWDQGVFELSDLKKLLNCIISKEKVIGIDICGECPDTLRQIGEWNNQQINDKTNGELLRFLIERKERVFIQN